MAIKLSRILRFPNWYQRSLKLLFNELEKLDEFDLNQEIYLPSEKLTIQLDRKILKKYISQSEPDENIIITQLKFDVGSENDSNNPDRDYRSDFLNTDLTIYQKRGRVLVKKKRRLTHTTTSEAHAAQHQHITKQLYPLTTENTFLNTRRYQKYQSDSYEPVTIIKRSYHTQIAKPRGYLLSETNLSCFSFNDRLRLFLCIVDEVESLEVLGINYLNLSTSNIVYDRETHQVTILNYAVSQERNELALGMLLAQLMGIPLLKIQVARTHPNFAEEIINELKKDYKSLPDETLEPVVNALQNFLQPDSFHSFSISEAKNLILEILNRQQVIVPRHVQNSAVKDSFFRTGANGESPALLMPLYHKLQAILSLSWNKASRFIGKPGSIEIISKIMAKSDIDEKEKLIQIQKFCEKQAALPKWKRVLRGRKTPTHQLICLLQQIDELPMHQLINQLDLFIGKFNQKIKLDNQPRPANSADSNISNPLIKC